MNVYVSKNKEALSPHTHHNAHYKIKFTCKRLSSNSVEQHTVNHHYNKTHSFLQVTICSREKVGL